MSKVADIFGLTTTEAKKRVDTLTPKEKEVAALYAEGLRNTEVAKRLGNSPKTLDVHRKNICLKLVCNPWGIGRVWYCAQLFGLKVE